MNSLCQTALSWSPRFQHLCGASGSEFLAQFEMTRQGLVGKIDLFLGFGHMIHTQAPNYGKVVEDQLHASS